MHSIFVYGTLKQGFPNHHHLKDANFLGTGQLADKYPLVIASHFNIPYLLFAADRGHNIRGEVFGVTDSQLECLDELEGYPGYYNRVKLPVIADSVTVECYVYVLDKYEESLLEYEMTDFYSKEDADQYILPGDRPTPLDRNEVMAETE